MNRRKVAVVGIAGTFPTCESLAVFEEKVFSDQSLIRTWPEAVAFDKKMRSQISGFVLPEESGIEPVISTTLRDYPEFYRELSGRISAEKSATADMPSLWCMQGALEAIDRAGWSEADVQSKRTGVILGSAGGGNAVLRRGWDAFFHDQKKSRLIGSHNIDRTMTYREAANVSCLLGTQGICEGLGSACATGLGSIGYAYRMIAHGYQDRIITGGAEGTSIETFVGFDSMGVLSRGFEPAQGSRPFDVDRRGFVCSFGSGIVLLEAFDLAVARGAPILAVIEGYHNNADGDGDMFSPSFDGQRRLWSGLFDDIGAEVRPDVVKVHGTSTPTGDGIELNSVISVLGKSSYAISAPKSQFGHMLGAAGSVEFIVAVLMLKRQQVSPCLNSDNLNPELEEFQKEVDWAGPMQPIAAYRDLLPLATKNMPVDRVACLNYGFGGTNAAMMLKRADAN